MRFRRMSEGSMVRWVVFAVRVVGVNGKSVNSFPACEIRAKVC